MSMLVKVLLFISFTLVIAVAAYGGYQFYKSETALRIENQSVTGSVHIKSVYPLSGGFITISALSVNTVGYVTIGTSSYLFPEHYTDINISLDQQNAQEFLIPGSTLRIQLHEDKGAFSVFESNNIDKVVSDFYGRPIQRFIRLEE